MPLYDNPPHVMTVWHQDTATDAAGGTTITYVESQTGLSCSVNLTSAAEREMYAQLGIDASHTVGFLGAAVSLARGDKLTGADDTPTQGLELRVEAIRASGLGYGSIPPLTYAVCSQIL